MDHDSSQSRQYYQTYLQVATEKKKKKWKPPATKIRGSLPVTFFQVSAYLRKDDLDDDPYKKKLIKRESKLPLLTP